MNSTTHPIYYRTNILAGQVAPLLEIGGAVLVAAGLAGQSNLLMAVATLATSLGYTLRDYSERSVTPMTVYAIFMGIWSGVGNSIGLMLEHTDYRSLFFTYAVDGYFYEAQILASMSVFIPLYSYRLFSRGISSGSLGLPRLPSVSLETPDRTVIGICLLLLAASWGFKFLGLRGGESLGTAGAYIALGSQILVFAFTWHWFGPKPTFPTWTKYLIGIVIISDVVYAFLFSVMRGQLAYPLLAFFLAVLMRGRFSMRVTALIVLMFAMIGFVYQPMGMMRNRKIYGFDRLRFLVTLSSEESSLTELDAARTGLDSRFLSLVARGCQFDQFSQVARIVDEEGLQKGKTLEFLKYAFIPRMVWPDKPQISPGQWFAEKIGRGYRIDETRFSNSINMNVAGDAYINFGWIGAAAALVIVGAIFAYTWHSTKFFTGRNNITGQILGLLILKQSTGINAVTGLLNLVFVYLAMLVIRWVLTLYVPSQAPQAYFDEESAIARLPSANDGRRISMGAGRPTTG